jgi:hypothetical protein
LTGRIVPHGANLATDAELVDVDGGWRLSGERYISEASDVLAVPEELPKRVEERLRSRLNGAVKRPLEERYPLGCVQTGLPLNVLRKQPQARMTQETNDDKL